MKKLLVGKYVLFDDFENKSVVKAKNKITGEMVALKRVQAGREEGNLELKIWSEIYPDDFKTSFTDDGWFYIERTWLLGKTVREKVSENIIEADEALKITLNILYEVKKLLDSTGLAHGDIKPDNILVTDEGIRLLDFESVTQGNNNNGGFDIIKTIKSISPGYSAPEKFMGITSSLSDIYSIGRLLHFMVTGNEEYEETEGDVQNIISVATEGDPKLRYASIDEMISAVSRVIERRQKALEKDIGGVLFPNVTFGYRRLIMYIVGPMAFAAELAVRFAEKGMLTGFCEMCSVGKGISKYYLGKLDEYDYLAAEPETCYGEQMLNDFEGEFAQNPRLKITTKKIRPSQRLDNNLMRDFMVKCYSDFDMTILYDGTGISDVCAENKAQMMRFCDYVVVPVDTDVDKFEEEYQKITAQMVSEGIPTKRLKIVGWDYCENESADESLLKLVAGDHYLGAISKDSKRKTMMNITGGYYASKIPENIAREYDEVITKIVSEMSRST